MRNPNLIFIVMRNIVNYFRSLFVSFPKHFTISSFRDSIIPMDLRVTSMLVTDVGDQMYW